MEVGKSDGMEGKRESSTSTTPRRSFCLPSFPIFFLFLSFSLFLPRPSSYIPEISASFHTGVITALSFFSSSPFRVGFSPFFFFVASSSFPAVFGPAYLRRARLLPTRGGGGRTVTSAADFMLECSHLESMFSCMESVDIYFTAGEILPQSSSFFFLFL